MRKERKVFIFSDFLATFAPSLRTSRLNKPVTLYRDTTESPIPPNVPISKLILAHTASVN